MPIYAYRCESCGHAKDVLQKISDPVLTVCPACGQETFRKQVTAAGFQLKGSGWYVTDFRGDKPAQKGGDSGESAAKGESGGASKGDAAAKSEPGAKADAGAKAESGAAPTKSEAAPAPSAAPAAPSASAPAAPPPAGGKSS